VNDQRLLKEFIELGSQNAFSELSKRHMGMVYSTCRRELGDSDLAQDATQAVFLLLAQKAKSLSRHPHLPSWLFYASRLVAKNVRKIEQRQIRREQAMIEEAIKNNALSDPDWHSIDPLLNDALEKLKTIDRDVILLRYFEERTFADIGSILGITEEGARKRVERALNKMRAHFQRRDVVVSISALSLLLTAHAAKAVPAGCAAAVQTLSASALPESAALTYASPHVVQITQGALKSMTISNLKIAAAVGAAALIAAGAIQHIASGAGLSSKTQLAASASAKTDTNVRALLGKTQRAYASTRTLTADYYSYAVVPSMTTHPAPSTLRVMKPNFVYLEPSKQNGIRIMSDGKILHSERMFGDHYETYADSTVSHKIDAVGNMIPSPDGSDIFPSQPLIASPSAFFNFYAWLRRVDAESKDLSNITYVGKKTINGEQCDVLQWTCPVVLGEPKFGMYQRQLCLGQDHLIREFDNRPQGGDFEPGTVEVQQFQNIRTNVKLDDGMFRYTPPTIPLAQPTGSS
jgi:RNA polymerase sigma factor (sigma-70 family)